MVQPMRADEPDQHTDLDDTLASMTMENPEFEAKLEAWCAWHEADMRRTGRIPSLADYRRVYATLEARDGIPQPTDEEIRAIHVVAP